MCRYRIIVEAEDATAAYTFVLMDCAVQRLVRMTATELLSENNLVVVFSLLLFSASTNV